MEKCRRGSQLLKVVRSSRQRNKQYYLNYQQLTEDRRYQISALLERGISASEIAKTVQCHRSTVYRGLKRGCPGSHYRPKEPRSYQSKNAHQRVNTVLGKHGTGAMVTILERKTRFYVVNKVPSKSADDVTTATIECNGTIILESN